MYKVDNMTDADPAPDATSMKADTPMAATHLLPYVDFNSEYLNSSPRTLITAIQAKQTPPRNYTGMRIFPIAICDREPQCYMLALPAQETSTAEGPLKKYTTMTQMVPGPVKGESPLAKDIREQLNQQISINRIVDALLLGYFGQKLDDLDLPPTGINYYEDVEDGELVLVVAVLLVADVIVETHEDSGRAEKGWTDLFSHQVEGMSKEQFDPPNLRKCILDAFTMLE
jgi:hypothetical protein